MRRLQVVSPKPQGELADLVEDWLASCRARGLSPKTIKSNYGYALQHVFLPFCQEEGVSAIAQVDQRLLDRFTSDLLEKGGKRGPLSRFSIQSLVQSTNFFLNWAHREGIAERKVNAQSPRLPKRLLDVLSREEIQAMEDAANNERDKLIVRLLADTGMRSGELVGLREDDLIERDRNHYLRVIGKGDQERLIPVPRLWRRLQRFIEKGRPRDRDTDHVFVGLRRGPSGGHEPLQTSGVEQLVGVLAEKAGLKKRVYPHLFRHSYATWALNSGMNPVMLAQVLGHRSLVMIQRNYCHSTPADAHELLGRLLAGPGRAQ